MSSRQQVFGTPFDLASWADVREGISRYCAEVRPFAYCVTPNVDHVVRLNKNPELEVLYSNARYSVCDSRILQLLAKFCGVSFPDIIAGSDLTQWLFENLIQADDPILIIGSEPELVQELIKARGLNNVVHHNPPMGFVNREEQVEECLQLGESKSFKYLFFAVGSPRQEILAHKLKERGVATGMGFCIGASINFLIGAEQRAPKWLQKIRMEWFYRFLQDPKRLWKRYFWDGMKIFPLAFKEMLFHGKR